MGLLGYHLKMIHTVTRVFVFEKSDNPQDVRYHIGYSKKRSHHLPNTLREKGWQLMMTHRNWYVLANDLPPEKRKTFPVREGIVSRNRKMMYIFSGMFIYTLLTSLLFAIMCSFLLLTGYAVTIEPNAFWMATAVIGVILWTLAPYSTIK